jgi:hypothetical protein
MRTLFAACLTSALCLAATPALAQSVTDAEANSMLDVLSTPAFTFCTDSDNAQSRPAIEQYNSCQTALAELAQVRQKNAKATPGQQQVYIFFENAIEMGHTYTMLRVDGSPTPRVCGNIERQWTLAHRPNLSLVGPELSGAFTSTKDSVRPLVKLCRERFAAPAGALAV